MVISFSCVGFYLKIENRENSLDGEMVGIVDKDSTLSWSYLFFNRSFILLRISSSTNPRNLILGSSIAEIRIPSSSLFQYNSIALYRLSFTFFNILVVLNG